MKKGTVADLKFWMFFRKFKRLKKKLHRTESVLSVNSRNPARYVSLVRAHQGFQFVHHSNFTPSSSHTISQ